MFGRDPSIDTCIEVLRDNDYIILEGDDAKKNLSELEEIYGDEFVKAVESWLREKGKVVADLDRYDGAKISRNELPCRDCSHEDYCSGNTNI